MAVSEIKKICLIGHKKYQEKILEKVYKLGFLEIIDLESSEKDVANVTKLDYKLAQIKYTLNFVNSYKPKEKSWQKKINNLLNPKIFLTKKKLSDVLKNFDYQSFVQRIELIENDLNEKNNLINKLKNDLKVLLPWKNLFCRPDKIKQTFKTNSVIGTMNKSCFELFLKEAEKNKSFIEINKIQEIEGEVYLLAIYHQSVKEKINYLFNKFEFKEADLACQEKLPKQAIKDIQKEIKIIKGEKEKIIQEIIKLNKHQTELKIIYDYLFWQKEKEEVKNKFLKTEKTFAFIGWIEKHNLEIFNKEIEKISSRVEIKILTFKKDEQLPVVLRNSNFVRPFESVTNIYGAPKSYEPDPTPYLAPFFILFFGLCLGDAGYGITLSLISFLAIKIFKIPKEKQGLFKLLIYGGLVTFAIGTVLGGWFGINVEILPSFFEPVRSFLLKIRIINPIEEPLKMLIFTLILGVIQVIVGICVNFYWNLKNKNWGRVFDSGIWLYFIFSILFLLLVKADVISDNFSQLAAYLIYFGIAAIILTQGRRQKNFLLKLPVGILSLYNVVGYLSDVLSYARILALGLATGVIAMVINLIAILFKDMIPYLGWVVAVIILLGGHIFNLAINTLGAFIHSGRLQFVEFFPKFMEGGGSRFRPFKKEGKFTKLQ